MKYKNLIDMHTHTDSSPDGEHAVTYMCEAAQKCGVRAIAFTDHCDVDHFNPSNTPKMLSQAFFETVKAQYVYYGDLTVCTGVELGEATYNEELSNKIVTRFKYDFILASIHNLRDKDDFYYLNYDNEDINALLNEYFKEELELIKWGKFDSLAHLTYPLRYIVGEAGKNVSDADYKNIISEILTALAKSGKALEINSSGLRQKYSKTFPDEDTVKMFRDCGGELITVGSDAHRAGDVGAGLSECYDIAVKCGFTNVALFQNHEPILIPII